MEVAHQVCILYAVVNGYLAGISVERIGEFERRLQELMDAQYDSVLTAIRTTGKLDSESENRLQEAIGRLVAEMGG